MKLTITNETAWSTRDLRRFVIAGLRHEGVYGKGHWRVRFCYLRRGRGSSGYAYLNSSTFALQLPNPKARGWATLPDYDRNDLAHVLWHEVAHCRGVRHGEMHGGHNGNCHGAERNVPIAWAAGLAIGVRTVKAKAPAPERRELAAVESLAAWQRKLKLAQTKVRKYRAKVAYYQKRKAACSPLESPAAQSETPTHG